MSEQSLTLLGINLEIIRRIQERENLFGEDLSTEERNEALAACDQGIKELVLREVKKADGLAYNLTEFRRRVGKCSDRDWKEPGAIDLEIDRLKKLKAQWLARHDYLEAVTITALQFIEQMEGRKRIEGERSTLMLRDNPPKVEVTQEGLLPAEFRRTTVTLDQLSWDMIITALRKAQQLTLINVLVMALQSGKSEPKRAEIARVLKSTEKCGKCDGSGKQPLVIDGNAIAAVYTLTPEAEIETSNPTVNCDLCKGTKVVSKGVPGARLVSGIRLEVK